MNLTIFGRARCVIAIVLLAAITHAAPLADAIDAARAQVRQNLAPKAPGFSIAVGRDGKILWSEGFGLADLAGQKPVTTQTRFRIGSVSKPLTAVGLMLLVEQEKINLDADIHQYVPDFPDKGALITTREVAGHLAGFRHYRGSEFASDRHYESLRAGLKIFENDPLLFKPGERFSYSSYGFNLISVVMESAAHEKFPDWMQQAVLTPLQMDHTTLETADGEPPDCTCFYQMAAGRGNFVLARPVDNTYKWGSGGFISTPEDLVRFGSALLHPGLLKRASLDTMFTSQKTSGGQGTGYGIGWFIRRDAHGHRIWTHSGGAVGGSAELLVYADTGVVIAMTANYEEAFGQARDSIQAIAADFNGVEK